MDAESIKVMALVEARYDYVPPADSEGLLSFRKGDVFPVVAQADSGWWEGHVDSGFGWFPSTFVTVLSSSAQRKLDVATIRLSTDVATQLLASLEQQQQEQHTDAVVVAVPEPATTAAAPAEAAPASKGSGRRKAALKRERKPSKLAAFLRIGSHSSARSTETAAAAATGTSTVLSISAPQSYKHTAHLSPQEAQTEEGLIKVAPHVGITMTTAQRIARSLPTGQDAFEKQNEAPTAPVAVQASSPPVLSVAERPESGSPASAPDASSTPALAAISDSPAPLDATSSASASAAAEAVQGRNFRLALFDHTPEAEDELQLACGDVLAVLAQHESGWWMGQTASGIGLFPVNRTRAAEPDEVPHALLELSALNASMVLETADTDEEEAGNSEEAAALDVIAALAGQPHVAVLRVSRGSTAQRRKLPVARPPAPPSDLFEL